MTKTTSSVSRIPVPTAIPRQRRPALVVSSGHTGEGVSLLWVVMITSAENRPWAGDVAIPYFRSVGLPAASVVRPAKTATVEARSAEAIGMVAAPARQAVMCRVRAIIGDIVLA